MRKWIAEQRALRTTRKEIEHMIAQCTRDEIGPTEELAQRYAQAIKGMADADEELYSTGDIEQLARAAEVDLIGSRTDRQTVQRATPEGAQALRDAMTALRQRPLTDTRTRCTEKLLHIAMLLEMESEALRNEVLSGMKKHDERRAGSSGGGLATGTALGLSMPL